ncbi:MAG: isocitrate/isopropylmalate dehydrogenase family protein [Anaerolineaceae bacterium]|nr:isocitrate/isopropylmalate dehydrogenase family protein [Anaerolineaceae bacterium]
MSARRICLLPGDGIGPEVIGAARRALEALPVQFEWSEGEIGFGAYQRCGSPLPEATLEKVRAAEATLFGAVTTPPDLPGYFSPILRLRKTFDLYANLRPIRSIPNPVSRQGIDMVIVRENTEGLYSGVERVEEDGARAVTERVITRRGSQRIARAAFELARKRGASKVAVVHKANVLRQTCGLFRRTALELAAEYPDLEVQELLVDTCAMELIRAPEQFQVIVTTNLFGDILSDEASMLVGGLGLAASGNLGEGAAVFEPVHGSAPKLVGTGQANPLATLLSAAMMLEHLGEGGQAARLRAAVEQVIAAGQVTPDLGGTLRTEQVVDEVLLVLEEMA